MLLRAASHESHSHAIVDAWEAVVGDVQVCAIPVPDDVLEFLKKCASIDQLVVVGAGNTALVDELTSARAEKILRKSNISLMFVHEGHTEG